MASAAPISAAASGQTAADADAPRRATTSSTWRAHRMDENSVYTFNMIVCNNDCLGWAQGTNNYVRDTKYRDSEIKRRANELS